MPGGLDDAEGLANLASQNDVVIHAATGYNTGSEEALITGLDRRKDTGESPIYIHIMAAPSSQEPST